MDIKEFEYDKPIIVKAGKHKGRIGYIDDEELPYVYVHFDELTFGTFSCEKILIKNVETVTHMDLINRMEELENLILSNSNSRLSKTIDYEKLFSYYEEYVYVSNLQTKYYINAFYLKPSIDKKIFISCSHKDIILANDIATDIKMAGYDIFLYSMSINVGDNIISEISKNISTSDILIPIISSSYNNSQFCIDEITAFYAKHLKTKPNSILPIRIDNTEIPAIFSAYKYFNYENDNYNSCIMELVNKKLR